MLKIVVWGLHRAVGRWGGRMLTEKQAPTPTNKKASVVLAGQAAKDLFDQIGPDLKDACSSDANYRERHKGHFDCSYTKENGYQCFFGIDLQTGKSLNSSIC